MGTKVDIVCVCIVLFGVGFFIGAAAYELYKPKATEVTTTNTVKHECVVKQKQAPRLPIESNQNQRVLVPIESVTDLMSMRVDELETEVERLSLKLSSQYTGISMFRNLWSESLDGTSRSSEEHGIIYNALLEVLDIYPTPSQGDAILILYDTYMRGHEEQASHLCSHNCTLLKWRYRAELIDLQGADQWLSEDHRALGIIRRQMNPGYPSDDDLDWFKSNDFWSIHFGIETPEEFQ